MFQNYNHTTSILKIYQKRQNLKLRNCPVLRYLAALLYTHNHISFHLTIFGASETLSFVSQPVTLLRLIFAKLLL